MDKDKTLLAEALETINDYWTWRHFDYKKWELEEIRFEQALDRWFARLERQPGTNIKALRSKT